MRKLKRAANDARHEARVKSAIEALYVRFADTGLVRLGPARSSARAAGLWLDAAAPGGGAAATARPVEPRQGHKTKRSNG